MPENYSKANIEYVYETDNKLAITFNMDNVIKNPLKVRSIILYTNTQWQEEHKQLKYQCKLPLYIVNFHYNILLPYYTLLILILLKEVIEII